MTGWTVLAFAIEAEVVGTTALRASNGLTRVVPIGRTAALLIERLGYAVLSQIPPAP